MILDEIGRGTSTFDGISIAWAVAEELHERVGCRAIFATHYHELVALGGTLARAKNLSTAVRERAGEIVFLHKLVEGGASRSYGIEVAKLAGIDENNIYNLARELLTDREAYDAMKKTANPYGDGHASEYIADAIIKYFGM